MPVTAAIDRRNQRNAVLAGFLGWTLDAFDFFILTLIIDDVANAFGKTRPQIALAITLTLAMRPLVVRGARTMLIDAGMGDKENEKFHDIYPEPLLLFYVNHLRWELLQAADVYLPASPSAA